MADSFPQVKTVMQAFVSLDTVTIGYPDRPILRTISFKLEPGASLAILGPNGCGKSTLLKTITGIVSPLAGEVHYHGPHKGGRVVFGYVPQRGMLDMVFPLTVREVVEMGTYGRVGPGQRLQREDRECVSQWLHELGVENLASTPFSLLSGGQQQRVLIVRALVTDPDVLVLDEPLTGVDPLTAEALVAFLSKFSASSERALLWASHHLAAVRLVVREAAWIDRGELIRGPVDAMLAPERVRTCLRKEGLVD